MRNPKRPATGLTLLELLVYVALLLVLLAGLYLTLLCALRFLGVAQANQEVSQEAMKAGQALRAELSETRASTVAISSDPPGILFLSARDRAGQYEWDRWGRLKWQKWVAYYLEGDRLLRREQALESPSTSSRPDDTSLSDVLAQPDLPERIVARGVAYLEFVGSDPVEVRLATTSEASQGTYRLEMRSKVGPRS